IENGQYCQSARLGLEGIRGNESSRSTQSCICPRNPHAPSRVTRSMFSHVSLGTNDAARAASFYDPVLAVLGIGKGKRRGESVDYSAAMIGFSLEQPVDGEPASVGNGAHVAFIAESRAAVDEFHRTALAHGGTDAGAP